MRSSGGGDNRPAEPLQRTLPAETVGQIPLFITQIRVIIHKTLKI